MEKTFLSVIVPLYNAEQFINQLIDTFLQQTYSFYEVVFIDDGSTDNTHQLMKKKLADLQDDRFKMLSNEKNLGISQTKNKALKCVQYDYIMFFDQDDLLSKDALSLLMEKVDLGSDYVVGNYCREYTYKKSFYDKMFEFQPVLKEATNKSLREIPELLITIHQALWAKVYDKKLFDDFEFDEELHGVEDLGSTSILLAKAKKISVVEKVIYYYQYSKTSTINEADSSYVVEDTYNAYNNFYNYYEHEGLVNTFLPELEYLYIYHCVLSVLVRTYQRTKNYQQPVERVFSELMRRYPNYRQNKYYKSHLKISKYFIVFNKSKVFRKVFSLILNRK